MLDFVRTRLPTRPAANEGAGNARTDHRLAGDQYRDAKEWEKAGDAYLRHVAAHPGDAGIWVQAGNCLKEAGDFIRSLDAYQHAEALEPKNFDVHLQLGHLHKIMGSYAAALAAYEAAAVLNPDFGEIRHEIQGVLERMKAPGGEAARLLSDHPPKTLDALLAVLKLRTGDDDLFTAYFRSLGVR